jgi:outer membrane biosynthesis protein TonB
MSTYTITIAPDDRNQATTTLRIEVTRKGTRITELLVRAGDGDGISASHLPTVDLEQLLRAVVPATTPAKPIADAAPPAQWATTEAEIVPSPAAPVQPAPPVTTTRPKAQPATQPRTELAAEAMPAPSATKKAAASARSRRNAATPKKAAAAAKSAAAAGSKTRAPRGTAAKPAKRATKKSAAVSSDGGRTYRRAPEDLETVLRQAGTAAAVADHYGVPKHTAYGWLRKLRSRDTGTAAS